jgi:hypothetical protein
LASVRQGFGDHAMALLFERFVVDPVSPGRSTDRFADPVAMPRFGLPWVCAVSVQEYLLELWVCPELLRTEAGEIRQGRP